MQRIVEVNALGIESTPQKMAENEFTPKKKRSEKTN